MVDITTWINKKAALYNMGDGGVQYHNFNHFNVKEIMRHFGIYMLSGIYPSPCVDMKCKSQEDDVANESNLCFRVLGHNSKKRHTHSKASLAIVDPLKPVPERKKRPNWKCHPILKHTAKVSQCAIRIGENTSIDKQTIGCKGRHPYIIRTSF